jgi:hypothetical protein
MMMPDGHCGCIAANQEVAILPRLESGFTLNRPKQSPLFVAARLSGSL